jgi:PHS family inorganic phosphate transporter-like MFS transporter
MVKIPLAYTVLKFNIAQVWRLLIGLGAIPCACAIYFRLTIPETPRYTIEVDNNLQQAVNDFDRTVARNRAPQVAQTTAVTESSNKASWRDFCEHFRQWKHFKVLLGTSISWFAVDVAFYGINLNASIILQDIGFTGSLTANPWNALFQNALGNFIVALMGTVPGYWVRIDQTLVALCQSCLMLVLNLR